LIFESALPDLMMDRFFAKPSAQIESRGIIHSLARSGETQLMTMKFNAYVNFPGTCAEAFRYYEKHLSAKTTMMMTHAEAPGPGQANAAWKDKVLHGRITIGDTEMMAADIPNAEPMRSAYLTLRFDSDEDAERVYRALRDGGQELMPIQETFFASRFGQVRDRFGVNWMILRERPMPPGA
jgi:PhnB protein